MISLIRVSNPYEDRRPDCTAGRSPIGRASAAVPSGDMRAIRGAPIASNVRAL